MIEKINLNNILFLDIETVPEVADFNQLDDEMKALLHFLKNVDATGTSNPQDYQPEILGTFSLEKK